MAILAPNIAKGERWITEPGREPYFVTEGMFRPNRPDLLDDAKKVVVGGRLPGNRLARRTAAANRRKGIK